MKTRVTTATTTNTRSATGSRMWPTLVSARRRRAEAPSAISVRPARTTAPAYQSGGTHGKPRPSASRVREKAFGIAGSRIAATALRFRVGKSVAMECLSNRQP
jgi:hypothetical protein